MKKSISLSEKVVLLTISCVALGGISTKSYADFNFYEEKCEEVAELGCKTPLVPGPTCLVTARGACAEFKKVKKCEWKAVLLGAPIWTCHSVIAGCKVYHQVCKKREMICKSGYKEACKNVLRPYAQIKDELAWLLYQEYMKSVGSANQGRIHSSISEELQPYYTVNLQQVIVSVGSAADGAAITDCNHIHFPDEQFVNTLKNGDEIEDRTQLHWLLHELKHVQQCQDIGGRKKYAVMWFGQFEITLKFRIDETIRDALSLLTGKGAKYVHDAMPLEKDAEDFADETINKTYSMTEDTAPSDDA